MMTRFLMVIALCGLILGGCSAANGASNASNTTVPPAQVDVPLYSIEQMLNGKTDLVVLANVESVSNIKDGTKDDPESSHQEAVLRIEETFYGQAKDATVKLYQSTDKVKANQKYLLFLTYKSDLDQYVVSDGLSQTEYNNGKLEVKVRDIQGTYTIDELKKVFAEKKATK